MNKYLFFQKRRNTEKEGAKYIWKRKIFFAKRDKEKEEIFRERKYHLLQRRGTMEKEKKENTFGGVPIAPLAWH